jgi:hypothetical protein
MVLASMKRALRGSFFVIDGLWPRWGLGRPNRANVTAVGLCCMPHRSGA